MKVWQWFISNYTPLRLRRRIKAMARQASWEGTITQGRLAQLVRAFDSHSKGRWFESTSDHIWLFLL